MVDVATEKSNGGRVLVALAAVAIVLPEILAPVLAPDLGGIDWVRLGLTILLAAGIIVGIRWVRWLTVGLVTLGLLVGLVGSGIFSPPLRRVPYLVLLAAVDTFVLYVLLLSDSAARVFEVHPPRRSWAQRPLLRL